MTATLSITELNYLTQNTDHHTVILFFLIYLIGDQGDQLALLRIKFDRIKYSPMNNFCIEWSVDVIRYPHLVGLFDTGRRILTGDHDHRNIIDPLIFIQELQNFKSIHDRHHNIEKHKRDTGSIFPDDRNTFLPILCLQDLKFISENC